MTDPSAAPPILTVSQLNQLLRDVLAETFDQCWVAGELSNCTRAASGHWYLTLKDDDSQLRAVIWRNTAQHLKFTPEDGLAVIARGRLDLYPPRGTYQLVIEELQPRGIGAAELALRRLKEKLAAEGLFDPVRKRPLPRFPRRIAIVTSPTGAAVRDFLEVLKRRWQGADVLIIPARVQGAGSAEELTAGVLNASRLEPLPDVLVVARGGGASEDLWSFNDERLLRAMAAAPMPVVSAVGHEIDVTLADLVADVRALTPSEAAERVVPSAQDIREGLFVLRDRLSAALTWRASSARRRLEQLSLRPAFRRPFDRVMLLSQRLDDWRRRTRTMLDRRLERCQAELARAAARIEALSPLQTLGRGYSLTTTADGRVVTDAAELEVGQTLRTQLARGTVTSRVESVETP